jgi:hypothetical protein
MGVAAEGFEPSGEVVGVDEVLQVGSQLVVGLVEVAFDGGILDGGVHSFDLAVGPWMLGLCQPALRSIPALSTQACTMCAYWRVVR